MPTPGWLRQVDLPQDSQGRRYIDPPNLDQILDQFMNWRGDVNAAGWRLLNCNLAATQIAWADIQNKPPLVEHNVIAQGNFDVCSATPDQAPSAAALEIREVQKVENSKGKDLNYAPRISFHWRQIAATSIGMDGDYIVRTWGNSSADTYASFAALDLYAKQDLYVARNAAVTGNLNLATLNGMAFVPDALIPNPALGRQIVTTSSSGHIFANWFNCTANNELTKIPVKVFCGYDADNFIRWADWGSFNSILTPSWSKISGAPANVSAFGNDMGYLQNGAASVTFGEISTPGNPNDITAGWIRCGGGITAKNSVDVFVGGFKGMAIGPDRKGNDYGGIFWDNDGAQGPAKSFYLYHSGLGFTFRLHATGIFITGLPTAIGTAGSGRLYRVGNQLMIS